MLFEYYDFFSHLKATVIVLTVIVYWNKTMFYCKTSDLTVGQNFKLLTL